MTLVEPNGLGLNEAHIFFYKILLRTEKVGMNLEDDLGWTPLSRAASNGNATMVILLLGTSKLVVAQLSADVVITVSRWRS